MDRAHTEKLDQLTAVLQRLLGAHERLSQLLAEKRTALRGASISADDIDEVILVGGATRMPSVQKLAEQLFERKPLVDPNPDLLVVRGAAIQAGLWEDNTMLDDIVVTDVCAHSLGVEITKTILVPRDDG